VSEERGQENFTDQEIPAKGHSHEERKGGKGGRAFGRKYVEPEGVEDFAQVRGASSVFEKGVEARRRGGGKEMA